MTKLASKRPNELRSIVSIDDNTAEIWYGAPVNLGRISYRGGSWYTVDNMRFSSAKDATAYLIKLYTAGTAVSKPDAVATVVRTESPKSNPTVKRAVRGPAKTAPVKEVTMASLLAFLKANPDVIVK